MLGTLVALAVARMTNLETFIWDLPTGVLRDVWLALSSLNERDDDEECRLEKVWVRWHNNWQADLPDSPPPPPPNVPPPNIGIHHNSNNHRQAAAATPASSDIPLVERVEHPSFSVLPALKSLTVLEIDELTYLDEMAILIARSQHKLRELRVGIAHHARQMTWVGNWDGPEYHQVDHSTTWTVASNIGDRRLQGVLGVLVGRIHNLKNNAESIRADMGIEFLSRVLDQQQREGESSDSANPRTFDEIVEAATAASGYRDARESQEDIEGSGSGRASLAHSRMNSAGSSSSGSLSSEGTPSLHTSTKVMPLRPAIPRRSDTKKDEKIGPYLNGQLRLETLELERIHLSMQVFRQAFDFTTITNLTLLNCRGHEALWKALRSRYGPMSRRGSMSYNNAMFTGLKLKKIHTNTVSSSLLTFIREALQPNTLETLFLQDCWGSQVKIEHIFTYAIKRHRKSLRKVLIDSGETNLDNFVDPTTRWRRWKLNRKIVAFLTSGCMKNLRELAISLDYADWVSF